MASETTSTTETGATQQAGQDESKSPSEAPRMLTRSSTVGMKRVKTIWITQKTDPFLQDFDVRNQIGSKGQFGLVHRCRRKSDKSKFAVKTINKSRFYRLGQNNSERALLLASMQGEIDILRAVKSAHPNIINFESVYEDKHFLYIVMEECRGGELMEKIQEKIRTQILYKEHECAKILHSVCDAIYFMHNYHRVVHCDLKPENILFLTKARDSPIKIVDFGMSQVLPKWRQELTRFVGTPYYTAPEIMLGKYEHSVDMWSIGVIMFLMLFGFPPFYVDKRKYYGYQEQKAIYQMIRKGFDPTVKRGYGPWFPKKIPVSDSARDLMTQLLTYDKEERITAKKMLDHEWIKQRGNVNKLANSTTSTASAATPSSPTPAASATAQKAQKTQDAPNLATPNTKASVDDASDEKVPDHPELIQRLVKDQETKMALVNLFQNLFAEMKPNHFKVLKTKFKEIDSEGKASISLESFKNCMTQFVQENEELAKLDTKKNDLFGGLDSVAGNEEIMYEDLLEVATNDYIQFRDEELYSKLRDLDVKEDGCIETSVLLEKFDEPILGAAQDIKRFIHEKNLEYEGKIDYELFLKTLHPSYEKKPKWFYGLNNNDTDTSNNCDVNGTNATNASNGNTKHSVTQPDIANASNPAMSSAQSNNASNDKGS